MPSSALTSSQLHALETTERVASCFSVIGTVFIMLTFIFSPAFRRPVNRLIFYASWGNALCNVATLMSQSGIRAGQNSHLCQLQGFLIQIVARFLPADALWNLAMAINVYMTLFRKYNAQQLKALEWRYQVMCYGLPFVVALVYLFIDSPTRGKIYGDASLWCWISIRWVVLRIALVYAPAWVAISISFTLYVISGREIFKKRQELRAFHSPQHRPLEVENPFTNFKVTEVEITHEMAKLSYDSQPQPGGPIVCPRVKKMIGGTPVKDYDQYSVKISSNPLSPDFSPLDSNVSPHTGTAPVVQYRNNKAAMEANTAAWGYTKVALLFFVSLLITWVRIISCTGYKSKRRALGMSIDRVSVPFTYASAVVLPLMGFWNSLIYITTSWKACKDLFFSCFFGIRAFRMVSTPTITRIRSQRSRVRNDDGLAAREHNEVSSLSESTQGLAKGDGGSIA
ncbi:MAG: hypothetical protein Q9222_004490 [Ikaeria aurantiellina]